MAEALDPLPVVAEPAPEPPLVQPPPALLRQEKAYPERFRAAVFAMGLLLGVAIAGFVILAIHHDKQPPPFVQGAAPGSKAFASVGPKGGWHPVCDVEFGCDRPHQIAAYVAPKYRLPSGTDAVAITSGPPVVSAADGSAVDVPVIVERNERGSRVVYTGQAQSNTVQYNMCGFGTACALGGTPTIERGDLLRRETLELALLTFKYDTTVDTVLTFFPKPAKATDPAYAFFYHRADYAKELARPLADTLGGQVVLRPGRLTKKQIKTIADITSPRVFKYEYRQSQQAFEILWLTPAAY